MFYRYINPCICDMEAEGTGREGKRLVDEGKKGYQMKGVGSSGMNMINMI